MTPLFVRRLQLAGVSFVVVSIASMPCPLRACDPVTPGIDSGAIGHAPTYPRNFVHVVPSWIDAGVDPRFRPDPVFPWHVPVALFEPGTTVDVPGGRVVIGDRVDTSAPTRPTLVRAKRIDDRRGGCGCCPDFAPLTQLEFEEGTDDQTAPADLGYLVFGGRTEAEALEAERALEFVQRNHATEILALMSEAEADASRFVAIAAVDLAGNVSERSAAVRLRR